MMTDTDVACRWAELLRRTAGVCRAPDFAWRMAEAGCRPDRIRMMADLWIGTDYEPEHHATTLREFADELASLSCTDGPVWL
jgi:hypothetical protein